MLEVKGVSKHFGGVKALNNVSMNLQAGEVLALAGDCLLYTSDAADE